MTDDTFSIIFHLILLKKREHYQISQILTFSKNKTRQIQNSKTFSDVCSSMLSVASLPIGAPGPTLHWRNTDMEQVVFMVMVIITMMMMMMVMMW